MKVHDESVRKFKDVPQTVPDELLSEEFAIKNHDQSLAKLNSRGGLGVMEILDNIYKRRLSSVAEDQSHVDELNEIIAKHLLIKGVGFEGKELIWWTNQEDSELVTKDDIAKLPEYIASQFKSRLGRAGRGRLWVADLPEFEAISKNGIMWYSNAPNIQYLIVAGGIVIRNQDYFSVHKLPGIITSTNISFKAIIIDKK